MIEEADLVARGFELLPGPHGMSARHSSGFVIHQSAGVWFAQRLNDHEIAELTRVASTLNAIVVGDEGETYRFEGGQLIEDSPPVVREISARAILNRYGSWIVMAAILGVVLLVRAWS